MGKRKAPVLSVESIRKLIANPRTPPQLKAYWKKELIKRR